MNYGAKNFFAISLQLGSLRRFTQLKGRRRKLLKKIAEEEEEEERGARVEGEESKRSDEHLLCLAWIAHAGFGGRACQGFFETICCPACT
jgi:hypothetical protein